jgi:RNA polymerase sigma-70 factor (ECF subfamily)
LPPTAPQFPAAYLRFLPPVRSKCRRLLRHQEDAEDVAHESFARLWQSGPSWSNDGDTPVIMAWLYRTSTRLAIDLLRRRARFLDAEERDVLPCGASTEHALDARRMIAALSVRVASEELEAAVLCRVDGLPQPEAASVLGVSERTVRRLLDRFDAHTAAWRKEFAS